MQTETRLSEKIKTTPKSLCMFLEHNVYSFLVPLHKFSNQNFQSQMPNVLTSWLSKSLPPFNHRKEGAWGDVQRWLRNRGREYMFKRVSSEIRISFFFFKLKIIVTCTGLPSSQSKRGTFITSCPSLPLPISFCPLSFLFPYSFLSFSLLQYNVLEVND